MEPQEVLSKDSFRVSTRGVGRVQINWQGLHVRTACRQELGEMFPLLENGKKQQLILPEPVRTGTKQEPSDLFHGVKTVIDLSAMQEVQVQIPGSWKILIATTPVFLLQSHGQKGWQTTVCGVAKLDMT